MIQVRVYLYLAAGDLSEVAEEWIGEFPIFPRVDDYITRTSSDSTQMYKVIKVV